MMDQLTPEGVVFAFHDICHGSCHNNLKIIKIFGIGIADVEQEDSKKLLGFSKIMRSIVPENNIPSFLSFL